MKVVVVSDNYGSQGESWPCSWYIVADSALSNSGKPFFIPEGEPEVEVSLSMAIRFSRLGKYIAPKFVGRYFKEVAPALHFRLPEEMKKCREYELPISRAVSFDRSVIADKYTQLEDSLDNLKLDLKINGEEVMKLDVGDFKQPIEAVVNEYSKTNTIKIGDVMLPCIAPGIKVKTGDYLETGICGETFFSVQIK